MVSWARGSIRHGTRCKPESCLKLRCNTDPNWWPTLTIRTDFNTSSVSQYPLLTCPYRKLACIARIVFLQSILYIIVGGTDLQNTFDYVTIIWLCLFKFFKMIPPYFYDGPQTPLLGLGYLHALVLPPSTTTSLDTSCHIPLVPVFLNSKCFT